MNSALVLEKLTELNIMFSPKKSADEIQVLAEMWMEDLGHMRGDLFEKAVSMVRKNSKWFPVTADIVAAYRDLVAAEARNGTVLRIVESEKGFLSPEENAKMAAELRQKLKKIGRPI